MATSQLGTASGLTYGNLQGSPNTTATPPCHTDHALVNRGHWTVSAETRAAAPQDPFTAACKMYLDTKIPLSGENNYIEQGDVSHTCHSGAAVAHDGLIDDAQPQARGHTVAYKLAARLTTRSTGAPLATIIEQGSYSTLNSHGSLLSVGCFPSIKAGENRSPDRGPRRRSRSLDDKALHDIQEDVARELDASAVVVSHERLDENHGAADPASSTATPLTSYRFELQRSPASHSGGEILYPDRRGVKGFIRGVVQNVRSNSKTRSRSSSLTHAPIMDYQGNSPSSCGSSPQVDQQDQNSGLAHLPGYSCDNSTRVPGHVAVAPLCMVQTTNRAISSSGTYLSAHARLPFANSYSNISESATVSGSIPPALPYRTATRPHDWPLSKPAVHAGTRDVAQEHGMIQAPTSHHDRFDTSARYTFDGIPVFREAPPSMREASSARDMFASQNASFCSTVTSSYSGTVLGIDVDLQHDFSHPIRRSQSPPEPVWFTPQMAELKRQASFAESSRHVETASPSHALPHSITSSALTSLLPIAAASGIVRTNYDTPKISFYSPSGKLIQPENSSPQDITSSDHGYSPTVTSSYYNTQIVKATHSSGNLPIRPPLVPMTTPPTHKSPLPLHLRQYHNYGRSEVSQISSYESWMTPKGPVKGCDGVVRENSLTPRSGVFFPHGKDKANRSVKLAVYDLKAEAKFYKARFLTLVAAHSFAPSVPKGRTLQKRLAHHYNAHAREPHSHGGEARQGGYRQDVLGPLVGHVLRICFCQPYDDAGQPPRTTAVGACRAGEAFSWNGNIKADRHTKDAERLLPNVRVVGSGRRSEAGESKRSARRKTD